MHFDPNRLTVIPDFDMPQLDRRRTVRIYLPENYEQGDKAYPVLYMHDGQNVLDDATASYGFSWRAGKALDELTRSGTIPPVILVAVDCATAKQGLSRFDEYSPWPMDPDFELPGRGREIHQSGGEGEAYIEFLCSSLKPYIDNHYRTLAGRESTILAGSSMGGYISLYGGLRRPDVFGRLGVFSPAFWFNRTAMLGYVQSHFPQLPLRVYMDMGTEETSDDQRDDFASVYRDGSREMSGLLHQAEHIRLTYSEGQGHLHNEQAWSERLPGFLEWILKN